MAFFHEVGKVNKAFTGSPVLKELEFFRSKENYQKERMKLAPGMIIVLASAMPDFDEKREEFANNMFQRMFADQSQDM